MEEFYGFMIDFEELEAKCNAKVAEFTNAILSGIYVKLSSFSLPYNVSNSNTGITVVTKKFYYPEFNVEYKTVETIIQNSREISIDIYESTSILLEEIRPVVTGLSLRDSSSVFPMLDATQIEFLNEFVYRQEVMVEPTSGISRLSSKTVTKLNYDFSYYNWSNIKKLVVGGSVQEWRQLPRKKLVLSGAKINGGKGLNDINKEHFTLKMQSAYDGQIENEINQGSMFALPFTFSGGEIKPLDSKASLLYTSMNPNNRPPNTTFGIPCPPDWYHDPNS